MFRHLRSLTLGAAVAVALAAPAAAFEFGDLFHHGPRGNGELTSVDYDLKPAPSDPEVRARHRRHLRAQQKITLIVDKNLVASYQIEARGGVLVVDADGDPRPSRKACLEVTLSALDRLTVDGAGNITIRGYDGERLVLAVDGAGDLKADGKAGEVVVSVNGAGDIDARRPRGPRRGRFGERGRGRLGLGQRAREGGDQRCRRRRCLRQAGRVRPGGPRHRRHQPALR